MYKRFFLKKKKKTLKKFTYTIKQNKKVKYINIK